MTEPTAHSGNLLGAELSPYLLQHADNPVHWRPWGQAAMEEARARNVPILLSIGYAACHWCHVMAHESFENEQTAARMNALFVNVKVDREERPDVDQIYMSALHAMGEQGGWPLTMFLTPAGEPFWGGTYFPPAPQYGRPSFTQVLNSLSEAWRDQQSAILGNVAGMQKALASISAATPGDFPDQSRVDAVATALMGMIDPQAGGLRGAPKFPNIPIFRFLWQHARLVGAPQAEQAVHHLLRAMSQGGIYDHLGGGYARYSTDAEWLAPHFEKMLYDNGQILDIMASAHAASPDALYAERAAETVGWMQRDMGVQPDAEGRAAFAASEDADSEGEEGRFYVWTADEVVALLGEGAPAFAAAYDVTPGGNWEGHTILRRITPPGTAAQEASLRAARQALFDHRTGRIRPGRDDKVLADWNGLAISALARAAAVFDRPDWLDLARGAFGFVMAHLGTADGRVQHAWRGTSTQPGRVSAVGLLDDQASMARAALAMFEATDDPAYRATAEALADAAHTWFADDDGSYFLSASDAPDVPATRPRTAGDNATPSGTGLLAEVLVRLHLLTGEESWRQRATALIEAFAGAGNGLGAMPGLMGAAEALMHAVTVVVTGPADAPATQALLRAVRQAAHPCAVLIAASATDSLPSAHPAHGKPAGQSAAYLCRGQACSLPITDPAVLRDHLHRPA